MIRKNCLAHLQQQKIKNTHSPSTQNAQRENKNDKKCVSTQKEKVEKNTVYYVRDTPKSPVISFLHFRDLSIPSWLVDSRSSSSTFWRIAFAISSGSRSFACPRWSIGSDSNCDHRNSITLLSSELSNIDTLYIAPLILKCSSRLLFQFTVHLLKFHHVVL
eukprot:GEMP01083519.1.p1 GENE.GEMP01083519.1~~GEMP01083519.1.p1  ORF type:complete len:161 (-),score=13.32 GEMP01083519.1:223-705(-)